MRLGLPPHVGGEQHTRTEAQNSGWLQFFPFQFLLFPREKTIGFRHSDSKVGIFPPDSVILPT